MQTKAIHRVQDIVDGGNYGIRYILALFMVLGWSFVV